MLTIRLTRLLIAIRCIVIGAFLAGNIVAQSPQSSPFGITNYGTYSVDKIDAVNMDSGNDVVRIPLFSLPQLGKLKLSFSAVSNSTYWQIESFCDEIHTGDCFYYPSMTPPSYGGVTALSYVGPTIVTDNIPVGGHSVQDTQVCASTCEQRMYLTWAVSDSSGSSHPLYYDSTNQARLRTADGSGYLFYTDLSDPYNYNNIDNASAFTTIDSDGITTGETFDAQGHANIAQSDPTGNANIQYYWNGSDYIYEDSVGRSFADFPQDFSSSTDGCPDLGVSGQVPVGSVVWSVPGPNGGNSQYLVCYTNFNYHTNFWGNNGQSMSNPNGGGPDGEGQDTYQESSGITYAIQSIVLPDKVSYWGFIYDAVTDTNPFAYASLKMIHTPQGGTIEYGYVQATSCFSNKSDISVAANVTLTLQSRKLTDINGHTQQWTYNINQYSPTQGSPNTVTDSNGNDTTYTFVNSSYDNDHSNCDDLESQRVEYQGSSTVANPVTLRTTQSMYETVEGPMSALSSYDPGYGNALIQATTQTVDGISTSKSVMNYDTTNFVAAAPSCTIDASGTSCSPIAGINATLSLGFPTGTSTTGYNSQSNLKTTTTHYFWQDPGAPYLASNILNTPETLTVSDGVHPSSTTTLGYDNFGHLSSKTITNDAGPSLTTTTAWTSTGMVDYTLDGKQNKTSYMYDGTGVFWSSVTHPATSGVQHKDQYTWDRNTGNMLSHTDENGVETLYTYNDPFGRLTLRQDAYGKQTEIDTSYSYPTLSEVDTKADLVVTGDGLLQSSIRYDGLGHQIASIGPDGSVVQTSFDGLDHTCAVSNPSFTDPGPLYCSFAQNPALSGTDGITYYAFDGIGRKTTQTNQDLTSRTWKPMGAVTKFTDESMNVWQNTYDSLGRLTNVVEPYGASTTYTYDGQGNLWNVAQPGLARSFTYDATSLLRCASNPEYSSTGSNAPACPASATGTLPTGTVNYAYDANGNLHTKTNARGVTTTYDYDNLNRLTSKSFSDSSLLSSCYLYDGSGSTAYASGRLLSEWTQPGACGASPGNAAPAVSWRNILSYDPVGNITGEQQCVVAPCSSASQLNRTYDLAGHVITSDNGLQNSENLISLGSSFDSAGRLLALGSTFNGSSSSLFLSPSYGPFGLTSAQIGETAISTSSAASPCGTTASQTAVLAQINCYDNRGRVTSITDTAISGAPPSAVDLSLSLFPTVPVGVQAVWSASCATCAYADGSFLLDGTTIGGFPYGGGSVSGPLPAFSQPGTHTIQVEFGGDGTHSPQTGNLRFTVSGESLPTPSFTVSYDLQAPLPPGVSPLITVVSTPGSPTANTGAYLMIDGNFAGYMVFDENGMAQTGVVSTLVTPQSHLVINYLGNAVTEGINYPVDNWIVSSNYPLPVVGTLTPQVPTIYDDQITYFTLTLPCGSSCRGGLYYVDETYAGGFVPDNTGTAQIAIAPKLIGISAGSHVITINYSGDQSYTAGNITFSDVNTTSYPITVTADNNPVPTIRVANPVPLVAGQGGESDFSISSPGITCGGTSYETLHDSAGNPYQVGGVDFTSTNTVGVYVPPLSSGTYSYTFTYQGSQTCKPVTLELSITVQ